MLSYQVNVLSGIWKQDPDAIIWAQEGWEWGGGSEGSPMRNFIVCTVHLIYSGWLNLEDGVS